MELRVISPQKQQLFTVAWVEVDTHVGNFVIQPEHAPTVLSLLPGSTVLFRLRTGKQESIVVKRGMIEVTRTGATILLNE